MTRILFVCCLLTIYGLSVLSAQVKPPEESIMPEDYDPSEFPLWAHDIRRFEIIAFGSFPITYFISSLVYDLVVLAANNGSAEYALGTQRGDDDLAIIIGAAAITSGAVAIGDLIVSLALRNKNNKDEQRKTYSPDP